jgi:hypothetical protein
VKDALYVQGVKIRDALLSGIFENATRVKDNPIEQMRSTPLIHRCDRMINEAVGGNFLNIHCNSTITFYGSLLFLTFR